MVVPPDKKYDVNRRSEKRSAFRHEYLRQLLVEDACGFSPHKFWMYAMPHVRVRGLPFEDLESVAELLIESLAEITNTPNSHFTLEYQAITYLAAGGASPAYPFIEILWFDRGDEVKAKIAAFIDELIRPLIPAGLDITVLFSDLARQNYYENAERC